MFYESPCQCDWRRASLCRSLRSTCVKACKGPDVKKETGHVRLAFRGTIQGPRAGDASDRPSEDSGTSRVRTWECRDRTDRDEVLPRGPRRAGDGAPASATGAPGGWGQEEEAPGGPQDVPRKQESLPAPRRQGGRGRGRPLRGWGRGTLPAFSEGLQFLSSRIFVSLSRCSLPRLEICAPPTKAPPAGRQSSVVPSSRTRWNPPGSRPCERVRSARQVCSPPPPHTHRPCRRARADGQQHWTSV